MGGSLLLALRKQGFSGQIEVMARRVESREWAKAHGSNRELENINGFSENLNLILVTVPTTSFKACLSSLSGNHLEKTLFTDVASAKGPAIPLMESLLTKRHYLSSHPMTGSEKMGTDGACETLYQNKKTILTPHSSAAALHEDYLRSFWEYLKCQVLIMAPEEHDRSVAYISHMPHLLMSTLINAIAESEDHGLLPFRVAGTGLRDISRLAASNPELWAEILSDNREAVIHAVEALQSHVGYTLELLRNHHPDDLKSYLNKARQVLEERKVR